MDQIPGSIKYTRVSIKSVSAASNWHWILRNSLPTKNSLWHRVNQYASQWVKIKFFTGLVKQQFYNLNCICICICNIGLHAQMIVCIVNAIMVWQNVVEWMAPLQWTVHCLTFLCKKYNLFVKMFTEWFLGWEFW